MTESTRPLRLLVLAAALAGCAAQPSARSAVGLTTGDVGRSVASAPLAHEGGIVFLKPLSGISDAATRDRASDLGFALVAELKAERAMRDAGLLSEDAATAKYALAAADDGKAKPGKPAKAEPTPKPAKAEAAPAKAEATPKPAKAEVATKPGKPEATPPGQLKKTAADLLAAVAQLWGGLTSSAHATAQAARKTRVQTLLDAVKATLEPKKATFKADGTTREAAADGGSAVTTRFTLPGGGRKSDVVRRFDGRGGLLETETRLTGEANGVDYDCERIRAYDPDGAETLESDTKLTIDGARLRVRWSLKVGADGGVTGLGTVDLPNDVTVDLVATGRVGEALTIEGEAGGLKVKAEGGDRASKATATFDAGAAGAASLQVDLDAAP